MTQKEPLLLYYWYTFEFISYTIYVFTALYIVGIYKSNNAITYLKIVDNYSKIIVSLFLMWKFNVFQKKIVFTKLDRIIVFQSGVFLFLTTSLNAVLVSYLMKLKDNIIHQNKTIKSN